MANKDREARALPVAKEIRVSDVQRWVLYQIVSQFRARDVAEMRGVNAIFRDFDLEEIEAKFKAAGEAGVDGKGYGNREQVLFVPESTANYFAAQFDRLGEIFPAGKGQNGNDIPAGLQTTVVRAISPLLDQLEAAFPRPQKAAAPAP